jgi:hypothetical protein
MYASVCSITKAKIISAKKDAARIDEGDAPIAETV